MHWLRPTHPNLGAGLPMFLLIILNHYYFNTWWIDMHPTRRSLHVPLKGSCLVSKAWLLKHQKHNRIIKVAVLVSVQLRLHEELQGKKNPTDFQRWNIFSEEKGTVGLMLCRKGKKVDFLTTYVSVRCEQRQEKWNILGFSLPVCVCQWFNWKGLTFLSNPFSSQAKATVRYKEALGTMLLKSSCTKVWDGRSWSFLTGF